jgi:cation diffusion facilitator CzcD-associated flavoprotein CzcO
VRDFLVIEKSDGVGGTWRDNSYPDSGCDVPSHLYSFSFAPKPDWTRKWAKQPEILEYFESIPGRFGLGPHLRFHTEVSSLTWIEESSTWRIETVDATGNPQEPIESRFVVNGLGQLNVPNIPDIEGLDRFEGTVFHSARWDHDHGLSGEDVAVIGIGASAIQFVPPIAEEVDHLTLFQRSSNYVAPKPDRAFRSWERWAFEHVPFVRKAYRESIYWRFEVRFNLMKKDSWMGRFYKWAFHRTSGSMISEKLPAEVLQPDYQPGCRRVLISNDWYPTLVRQNVDVVTDSVASITEHAVVTSGGTEVPVDTIIFGTGFKSTDFLTPMTVTGREGADLNAVWAGEACAYMSLAVSGFPNLFMLYGPNSNLGHNSILFMIEQQVNYVLAAIEQAEHRGADSMDVNRSAMKRWDDEIVRRSADTVWATDCHSWYKTETGRITNNWIGHTTEYRKRLANPRWHDWEFSQSPEPADQPALTLAESQPV